MRHVLGLGIVSFALASCVADPNASLAGGLVGGAGGGAGGGAWVLEQCRSDYTACQALGGYATPDACWAVAGQSAAPEGYIRNCRRNA